MPLYLSCLCFVCLFVCLFVVCLSVSLSVFSIYLSLSVCLYVLSACLSASLFICLSACLSLSLSASLSHLHTLILPLPFPFTSQELAGEVFVSPHLPVSVASGDRVPVPSPPTSLTRLPSFQCQARSQVRRDQNISTQRKVSQRCSCVLPIVRCCQIYYGRYSQTPPPPMSAISKGHKRR